MEYRPGVVPKTTWKQDDQGLHITAYRAQRLYTDRRWPNALVLKITNVEPGLAPPAVSTVDARWDAQAGVALLQARLLDLGKADRVAVGFQYREKKGGTDLSERTEPWTDLPASPQSSPGPFQFSLTGLAPNRTYEYRARVRHPLITIFGEEKSFSTSR